MMSGSNRITEEAHILNYEGVIEDRVTQSGAITGEASPVQRARPQTEGRRFPVIEQLEGTDVCWAISIAMMIAWERGDTNVPRSGERSDRYIEGLLENIGVDYRRRFSNAMSIARSNDGSQQLPPNLGSYNSPTLRQLVNSVNRAANQLGISSELVPVEKEGLTYAWEDVKQHFFRNQRGQVSPVLLLPTGLKVHTYVVISYNTIMDYLDYVNRSGNIVQSDPISEIPLYVGEAYYWK
jgi:hypothetical protein